MTNTDMNISVNVMCHALVMLVRSRVVSLMRLSARSLWSFLAIAAGAWRHDRRAEALRRSRRVLLEGDH
jgi:hypothetical protein